VNQVSPLTYNILSRKQAIKPEIEKEYSQFKEQLLKADQAKPMKYEVENRILRTFRMFLCLKYSHDVQLRACNDSIKLQLLLEVDRLRKRSFLLPKEASFLAPGRSMSGEHEFAFYNDQGDKYDDRKDLNSQSSARREPQSQFHDNKKEHILDTWQIPSNHEIVKLNVDDRECRQQNPLKEAPSPEALKSSRNLANLMHSYMSKVTLAADSDQIVKTKGRLADFQEAYTYNGPSLKYLRYWRSVSDLYDLEFFINKLSSTAFTVATVEKSILSGVPFWEDINEMELQYESSSEQEEAAEGLSTTKTSFRTQLQNDVSNSARDKAAMGKKVIIDESEFSPDGHRPLENVLAAQVS